MDENVNFFVVVKAAITGVFTGFTVAFGWLGWLVLAWVACMAIDFATGWMSACKSGTWASSIARDGIFHKLGMLFVVVVAGIADGVLSMVLVEFPIFDIAYTSALMPLVLLWYILTELGSILENATEMGANVPEVLTKMLAMTMSEVGELTGYVSDTPEDETQQE